MMNTKKKNFKKSHTLTFTAELLVLSWPEPVTLYLDFFWEATKWPIGSTLYTIVSTSDPI